MLASEREEFGVEALGPTLVVCPMSVVKQWVRGDRALRAVAARAVASRRRASHRRRGSSTAARDVDVVVTSYDIATRDIETLARVEWDRLLLDEAQDIKNPATKRARALRPLRARRRVAMTGTPIENRLGELWAIMDIVNPGLLGSRDWFDRTFARPIEAFGDEQGAGAACARSCSRSCCGARRTRRRSSSSCRRSRSTKDYCRLTVEQASLYQATVDRWMPRIEEQRDSFGQRGVGARDAEPAEAGVQPPGAAARRRGRRSTAAPGSSTGSWSCSSRCRRATRRSSSRSTRASTGSSRISREQLGKRVGFFHGRLTRAAARRRAARVRDGGRPVGARDLDQGGRPRAEPAGGEPRDPLRPLVEPGGRAAGDRPRASRRPAQAGVRAQPHLRRHARGADRPAARVEARARSEGDPRRLRGLARRARHRRDPRRRRARRRTGWRRRHERAAGGTGRGRGSWRRAVVRDEGSAVAERGRVLVREGAVGAVDGRAGNALGEVGGCSVAITAKPVPPRIWAAMTRFARGNRPLEEAVEGRVQSVHLEHLMIEDWSEPLVPRPYELGRTLLVRPAVSCASTSPRSRTRSRERSTPTRRSCCAGAAASRHRRSRRTSRRSCRRPSAAVDLTDDDPWRAGALPEPRAAATAAGRRGAQAARPERAAAARRRPRRRAAARVRLVRRVRLALVSDVPLPTRFERALAVVAHRGFNLSLVISAALLFGVLALGWKPRWLDWAELVLGLALAAEGACSPPIGGAHGSSWSGGSGGGAAAHRCRAACSGAWRRLRCSCSASRGSARGR